MKKKITLLLSLVLAVAMGIGGTLAWLTAKTEAVKNTFTVGNIDIDLTETTTNYKMVPGQTIDKDPKVTVEAGSEACWLFVKIEKGNDLDKFIDYAVADGWTALTGVDGVYYREVAADATNRSFEVIGYESGNPAEFTANKVLVKDSVTKDDMDGLTADNYPTLTFTAYAIQRASFDDPAAAWTEASK